MNIRHWQILVFTGLFSCSALASSQTGANGKTLFEQGKYRQALDYFRQQQASGHASNVNTYNMAVTLYRLKRYGEARKLFLSLTKSSDWRPLADYNLGLIARATGNHARATHYFKLAADQHTNGKIRALAQARLGAAKHRPNSRNRWIAIVRARAGHDSNAPRLADDLMAGSGQGADNYMEWLGFAQTWLNGNPGDGVKFYALAFDRQFQQFSSLDTQVVGGDISWEHPMGDLHTTAAVRLMHLRFGGAPLANQLQADLSISKDVHLSTFSVSWLPARFFASTRYHQLDGSQQRLELAWEHAGKSVRMRARYRYEVNHRADLAQGSYFASYSPTRNGIKADALWRISPKLRIDVYAEFRHSKYHGVDSLRDTNGQVRTAVRTNNRLTAGSWLAYNLSRPLTLRLALAHVRSADTYDLYSYSSSKVSASLQYSFF